MPVLPENFSPYDHLPDALRGVWDGKKGPPGPIPGLPGIHLRRPRGVGNFINFIVTHPCADPWFALISTFAPAALKLGWTLLAPDWEDILRGFAEDYTRLPGGGGKRRKSHVPRKRMPIKGPLNPLTPKGQLRLTLFLTKPLETLGWWWLVWNATDQFFLDWHSLLQRVDYCSLQGKGYLMQRHNNDLGALFSPVGLDLAMSELDQIWGGSAGGPFGVNVPPGRYHIILWGEWNRSELLGGLENCRLRIDVSGVVLGQASAESANFTVPAGAWGGTTVHLACTILSFVNNISWRSIGDHGVGAVTGGRGRIIVMSDTNT